MTRIVTHVTFYRPFTADNDADNVRRCYVEGAPDVSVGQIPGDRMTLHFEDGGEEAYARTPDEWVLLYTE